ncbi:hypothetical protein UFOVP163_14 [uncultured Caudovirales phage]|uniref:Uncharacterized protein n=1 Tax=uncultured Caudovirales phage TaxID=2100421 RepID=A0A6J7WA48_9CAUD|nr:hypothetical protein UFOVP163_14 [uncultured Caudovirales phage]
MKSKTHKPVNENHGNTLYTDDMLIEWIQQFDRRSDLRKDSFYKYTTCLRRGLNIYFPTKKTKSGLEVMAVRLELLKKRDEEKEKEVKKVKVVKEKVKKPKPEPTRSHQGIIYPPFYKEGVKTCSRCRDNKTYAGLSLCNNCNNEVGRLIRAGLDHTPGNIKDEFCRTRITMNDGEKIEFEYWATPEQIQKLIKNGFGFILKPRKKIEEI